MADHASERTGEDGARRSGATSDHPVEDGHATVAVVDDDFSVRRAMQRLLRAMGFGVASFGSAEEFLVAVRLREFDCALLDVKLRGMSGLELYETLEELGYAIPVIFISATADAASAVANQTAGRGLFLCKPVDIDKLGDALKQRLNGKAQL